MEAGFLDHFKEVLPRLFIYLIVPFYLGLQLSFLAKDERTVNKDHAAGSYALDALGLLSAVGVPVFFIVSTLAIFKLGGRYPELMGGIFRYGLLFFFFGAWWQFFVIMALKAYRDRDKKVSKLNYLLFFVAGGVFISLNAFLGGEWFLKWMSLIFLAMVAPVLLLPCRKMCAAFLLVALLSFMLQTAGFIYVSSLA